MWSLCSDPDRLFLHVGLSIYTFMTSILTSLGQLDVLLSAANNQWSTTLHLQWTIILKDSGSKDIIFPGQLSKWWHKGYEKAARFIIWLIHHFHLLCLSSLTDAHRERHADTPRPPLSHALLLWHSYTFLGWAAISLKAKSHGLPR